MPSPNHRTHPEHRDLPIRLIKARNFRGWSSFQLANAAKLSASVVCNIENERNSPTAYTIVRLCKALNVSADYLLGLKEEMV
jgi:transcriptional regulator with XRE-family HTH domain